MHASCATARAVCAGKIRTQRPREPRCSSTPNKSAGGLWNEGRGASSKDEKGAGPKHPRALPGRRSELSALPGLLPGSFFGELVKRMRRAPWRRSYNQPPFGITHRSPICTVCGRALPRSTFCSFFFVPPRILPANVAAMDTCDECFRASSVC